MARNVSCASARLCRSAKLPTPTLSCSNQDGWPCPAPRSIRVGVSYHNPCTLVAFPVGLSAHPVLPSPLLLHLPQHPYPPGCPLRDYPWMCFWWPSLRSQPQSQCPWLEIYFVPLHQAKLPAQWVLCQAGYSTARHGRGSCH
jgi:hypothetical protein